MNTQLHQLKTQIQQTQLIKRVGLVTRVYGLLIESDGPNVFIGEQVEIYSTGSNETVLAEVIGIKNNKVLMMPYGQVDGIRYGSEVIGTGHDVTIPLNLSLLGRVIDAFGNPIDGKGALNQANRQSTNAMPLNPLTRPVIDSQIETGIKAIDTTIPLGKGQRIGLFAGSGVGKSTLMSMIAKNVDAEINVIALIGERGREVREFIEHHLSEEALSRSVIVVATSDTSALMRKQSALTATRIAEWFRAEGNDVSLMMDSITRYAMALREISLSNGEPPSSRGYTPSTFSALPKLLERAGTHDSGGSITGIYTVLVEGDDFNEPISDLIRATVDGHVVLSREIAERGQYPAINILKSESRVKNSVASKERNSQASVLRRLISLYEESRDLIEIGAYKAGANKELDFAVSNWGSIQDFLSQDSDASFNCNEAFKQLHAVVGHYEK